MDTKLIKEHGEDILCYRIRTARQKTRMQYEDFDKYLIALDKEETILYRHRPELEPLIPPVQRGWKRFFVLSDDVARTKDAAFYAAILQKINTEDWSYRKDFKIKKRRFGRKTLVVKKQELKKLSEWEFAKLNFSEEERRCFHAEFFYNRWRRKFELYYVFSEPWHFVLRVRPNMIDKQRKIDSIKEGRLQEIRNYLDNNDHRKRVNKILCGQSKYRHWKEREEIKPKEKYVFRNKSLSSILDTIREEFL